MAYTITGTEVLQILPIQSNGQAAATTVQVTTQQIASLADLESSIFSPTTISNTGGTTLPAAALIGQLIVRTGSTAAFTDTTDTAANILAALPSVIVGTDFQIYIKNTTAYGMTLSAGSGVTLPQQVFIPPYSISIYEVSTTSATTVTFVHILTDFIVNLYTSNTGLTTATNTTTFTIIPGFTLSLPNSGTYSVLGAVQVNCTAGGGAALAFGCAPSSTLTASSLNISGKFYTATGLAVNNTLTFNTPVPTPGSGIGTSAPIVLAEFTGSFTTNAAGTFQVYGGQQAANAGSTNFLSNGFLQIERIG